MKKLPTVKSLQAEYAELMAQKKAAYSGYRQARDEMKELLTVKANVDRIMGYEEEKQTEKDHAQEQSQDDDRLMDLGFSGGKACGGFPSCLLTGAGRKPGQECEAPPTGGLLLMRVLSCAIHRPGDGKSVPSERAASSRMELFMGAWGQRLTSNLGSSRQRKSQVWPRWVPRGIACRFLVPCIYALSGGISSNEKRGRLHILLLIIRVFQFDGSVNDTFHNGQILLRAKL